MSDNLSDMPVSQAYPWQGRLRRLWGRIKVFIPYMLGILAALIALILFNALQPNPEQITERQVEEIVAQTLASATPEAAISAQVYQVILPSLVFIQVESIVGEGEDGIGSGVIINNDAAILTAHHVIENAAEILVTFADGTQSEAFVAAEEPENDIAVLMPVTMPDVFLPAVIGSSGAMHIGDQVFAVGNPLGLAGSMSAGVISGFDRSFFPVDGDHRLEGLIQFDAAVNPGNSGGPLLNRYGQVVGIVTGLVNPTEQEVFIGIGFAVPINVAVSAAGGPAQ